MLHTLIWALAWLLVVGALLHAFGSYRLLDHKSGEFVWSLGSSLAAVLVAAFNLLMLSHPAEGTIALIACLSALAWAAVAYGFGRSIGKFFDPRVLWHMVCGLGLGLGAFLTFVGIGLS